MVTFSSLEHSGLGRYGDQLNPWGDLITMAKAWCVVKPGGQALVGVSTGPDTILVRKTINIILKYIINNESVFNSNYLS